ncbi:FitA-like ribbon-helix-helix domain-containing protein [Microbacterium sp. SA39]|uniref:FitA-like ribbon-helix-helix domain-containing protein n=1 Tax=Microbacterium sp. SA39 TaxID=1263625 RepID=UPI0005F9D60F|nr:hypothetical protein [Microbacterium sp. SA39]KJQ52590.1 hypothetical protein RS85_03483 [Microbacterium sp. SA39]
MATVTIRNLSDEVVAALKERARRNSRSMEAEAREALMNLVQNNDASGVEADLARRLPPLRWSVPGEEVMARIAANPPTAEQTRVAAEWAEELRAEREDPLFDYRIEDPWERNASA